MTADKCRDRGLGAARGCLVGLLLVAPFWAGAARLVLWLVLR